MTYAGIVEGMQFWKYVVNSYHNGWVQLPSSVVTLSGNTAVLTIVDNGEWDNDPTVGAIADPGGPGFDPNALNPPGQPTNVTGTAGNQSATLRWDAAASGGQPVRYIVAALINGVPSGQTCEATWPATNCTVQGLTNGQAYTFTVTAENGAGAAQAGVVVAPVVPLSVPDVPTGVSGTAGNAQAVVTFTPPGNTGGSGITGYTASCTSSDGGAAGIISGSASPLTVTGLTKGKTYTCAVMATNAQGTGAASTASEGVIPLGAPDVPIGVSAAAGNGQATIIWTAPVDTGGSAITGYTVTGSPSGSCTAGPTANSCMVNGLTNGAAYTFRVVATNAQGDSMASSASNSVTPQPTPVPPNPIPTLGRVGLAGLGSLLAGIGGWRQRRRAQTERKGD
jgi:hypothetical protein